MASFWKSFTGSRPSGSTASAPPTSAPAAATPVTGATPIAHQVQGQLTAEQLPHDQLDFTALAQGQHINLQGVRLVRADIPERMKAYTKPGQELLIVSRDSKGIKLVSIDGDYTQGALMVDPANKAIGFWMPETQWKQLPWAQRPTTAIELDGKTFIRLDLTDRIHEVVTKAKTLRTVSEYHGFYLLAEGGDSSHGLLMVDKTFATQGFWIPKEEYDRMGAH